MEPTSAKAKGKLALQYAVLNPVIFTVFIAVGSISQSVIAIISIHVLGLAGLIKASLRTLAVLRSKEGIFLGMVSSVCCLIFAFELYFTAMSCIVLYSTPDR